MTLRALVEHNYNRLNKAAYNITGSSVVGQDLMSYTYLHISDSGCEVPKDNEGFEKFFTNWMSENYKLPKSKYNLEKTREVLTEYDYADISPESEPCKECQFNEIELFKKALPPHEKILFELNIENRVSCRQIAFELTKEIGYPVKGRSIQKLLEPVREKIKRNKWNSH